MVKYATVLLFREWLPQTNIDARLVIHQHDEFQAEVREGHELEYMYLADKSFEVSGRHFNLNVPILVDTLILMYQF